MGKRAITASAGSGKGKVKCSISARCTLFCAHRKSNFKLYKGSKENIKRPVRSMLLNDRVSELPPEILVDILSQLKMKEAGRTSILSKNWRYVWTKIRNLDLDASEVLHDLLHEIKFLEVERPIYVSRVNNVIRLHQGETIDEFVIVFSLDKKSGSDIDRWVSFAVRKKVQRLKLDLCTQWGTSQYHPYSFPQSLEISKCSSLTSLHLAGVFITGEVLQLFLRNCLNLESLFVKGSGTLRSLNVDGPSLKLRWLELHICHNLEHLSVSAPNLLSFKYTGRRIPMPLKDTPKLLEISIQSYYSRHLTSRLDLSELSSYLSRLEKLTLEACALKENVKDAKFPLFPKLKHLTLIIATSGIKNLLVYAAMITASPSLHKFSIQILFDEIDFFTSYGRVRPMKVNAPTHSIREVEFLGFRGKVVDVELAMYLVDNAVMLEKITFDSLSPSLREVGMGEDFRADATRAHQAYVAIERAKEIGKRLPPGVELIIVE